MQFGSSKSSCAEPELEINTLRTTAKLRKVELHTKIYIGTNATITHVRRNTNLKKKIGPSFDFREKEKLLSAKLEKK